MDDVPVVLTFHVGENFASTHIGMKMLLLLSGRLKPSTYLTRIWFGYLEE